jgi:hypothetical protein
MSTIIVQVVPVYQRYYTLMRFYLQRKIDMIFESQCGSNQILT